MTEAEKQAFSLYEDICTTGKDRPYSANSLAEMMRKIAEWRASNSALNALGRASAEVQLAFLKNSFEWLQAEAKEFSRFQVCQAVTDAIQLVLTTLPKPLPTELVQRLLSEYRQDFSMTRPNALTRSHSSTSLMRSRDGSFPPRGRSSLRRG